jgi:hypothetical protein
LKKTLLELAINDNLTKGERYYVQTALKALPKGREPVEIKDDTLKKFAFICNEVRTPAGSVETDTVRYAIWALEHFCKGDNKEAVYWALTAKRLAEESKAVPYIVKALEKEVDFPKYIAELKEDSDKVERDNPEVYGLGAVHEKIIEREAEEPKPVEPQVALF